MTLPSALCSAVSYLLAGFCQERRYPRRFVQAGRRPIERTDIRYIAQKLSFLSSQVIEAAVMLAAVSAWLRFLYDQGLMTAERRADALRDLSKLVQQAEPIWTQDPSDPALGPSIRAAWERVAEG